MKQDIRDAVIGNTTNNAHKGTYGNVVVIGGSKRYTNTPAIVALAALRTGCELVDIAAPQPSIDNCSKVTLNVIATPLDGTTVAEDHVDMLMDRTEWADCVVIGPGIGIQEGTRAAVQQYLNASRTPTVVDADALRLVSDNPEFVRDDWILTPHIGEFHVLTGEQPPHNTEDRLPLVEQYAEEFGCTIMLKGATDVISDGERTEPVESGNPFMARGGTGDVLAGITAALMARHGDPFESAVTAAWVNGTAGDQALDECGRGFLLEDMIERVSHAVTPDDVEG